MVPKKNLKSRFTLNCELVYRLQMVKTWFCFCSLCTKKASTILKTNKTILEINTSYYIYFSDFDLSKKGEKNTNIVFVYINTKG